VAGRGWLGAELVSVARRTLRGVDVVRTSRLAAAAYVAGVRDTRVLKAMAVVPRSAYVPGAGASAAERDRPIAIGGGQVTTQPSLVAAMVEALDLSGDERVLEVGTGLGYQAAVLARLAREVWSVERRPELAAAAAANLRAQGIANAHVVTGDGSEGLREHAPFDAVILAAAHPHVPPPVAAQLTPGGRLLQPIGPSGSEDVILFNRRPDGGLVRVRCVTRARFVPLYGTHGFPADH
jgi:protein-L-isoaspartate(D-aspartate) O-methyltransferase